MRAAWRGARRRRGEPMIVPFIPARGHGPKARRVAGPARNDAKRFALA